MSSRSSAYYYYSSVYYYYYYYYCYRYDNNFCFVQGVGGAVHLPKGFLKAAYELIRERGGVCIADEVLHLIKF